MIRIGRHRPGRLIPPFAVTLLAGALAIAACDPGGIVDATAARKGTPTPAGSTTGVPGPTPTAALSGGISAGGNSTPAPGSSASPDAASPTPTASPTGSPSPTPTPPPAVAQYILISPTSGLVVHLPPPAGATPLPAMPGTLQLTAEVRLSNGAIDSAPATWTSSDESVATVSQAGLVSARTRTGAVKIKATSADQQASESVTVTVKSLGDVSVEVE